MNNPGDYWTTNVEGTRRIFERFKNLRILYASSSSAYEPTLNPYAASKFIMEAVGLSSAKKPGSVSSNLPTINLPPLIFGILPSLVYVPAFSSCQSSGRPSNVSKP